MKIVVIGGGVGGMFCSALLGGFGHDVLLLEKNEKLGKKMFISGKGRCNLTNLSDRQVLLENIVTNSKFMMSAISKFTPQMLMEFCENHGLPLKVERGNRVFPSSDKSSDVIKCFENLIRKNNVKVRLNCIVKEVLSCQSGNDNSCKSINNTSLKNGNNSICEQDIKRCKDVNQNVLLNEKCDGQRKVCCVVLESGEKIECEKVVIATGGVSYPTTGSTGDGLRFAKSLGHTIIQPKPALVPFLTSNVQDLAGLSLKNVLASVVFENGKELCSEFGEMLFTHEGMSGPIILSMSSKLNKYYNNGKLNQKFFVEIDLKPALSQEKMQEKLLREFKENQNVIIKNYLATLMPKSLVEKVLFQAKIDEKTVVNSITKQQRDNLIFAIKGLEFEVQNLDKIVFGIITSGGVDVKEVSPKDMQSKLVDGLYFVGEVVDVDALTGGFNIQIALSMAYVMADSLK